MDVTQITHEGPFCPERRQLNMEEERSRTMRATLSSYLRLRKGDADRSGSFTVLTGHHSGPVPLPPGRQAE